jgi:hypothetical protein
MWDWNDILTPEWAAVLVAIGAGLAAVITANSSNRMAKQVTGAEIIFQTDARLAQFETVHEAFRTRTIDERLQPDHPMPIRWPQVEQYMGVFERIHSFAEQGLLDMRVVWEFYGFRYTNILRSREVRESKLAPEAAGWNRFIELGHDLQRYIESNLDPSKRDPDHEPGTFLALLPTTPSAPVTS